mgnify:FL=1
MATSVQDRHHRRRGLLLCGCYNRDGDEIYTVVLNSTTTDQRFTDTATLANWYYGHKVTVAIANTQEKTANGNPLIARIGQTDWTDKTIDATLADPTAQATVFSLAGEVTEKVSYDDLSGTVHVGDKVGSVTLKQDGTKIASWIWLPTRKTRGRIPLSGSL